ncbi:VWA domain-containing protein [bacterium]|nr:VWA domain-containing protein [bacterium]
MKKVAQFCLLSIIALLNTHCNTKEQVYSNLLRSDVFVQDYAERKYDFLFVFDTSGSFKPRRDYVKNNMQTFISTLNSRKAVDYQIAVTTVDVFGGFNPSLPDNRGVRGNLVASNSGLKIVTGNSSDPSGDFASIMQNIEESNTSFWEQGLEAAYQVIFQHKSEFSRPGVPLVIIFMSDSDDWSCKDNCWGEQPETNTNWVAHPLSRYSDYFKTVKANENSEVLIFPIVGVPGGKCEVEFAGSRYISIQESLGGLSTSLSVCDADLPSSFNGIAKLVADRGAVFKLSSVASGSNFSVVVNNEEIPFSPENYIYDTASNSVVFTGLSPKKGSIIEIVYSERKS